MDEKILQENSTITIVDLKDKVERYRLEGCDMWMLRAPIYGMPRQNGMSDRSYPNAVGIFRNIGDPEPYFYVSDSPESMIDPFKDIPAFKVFNVLLDPAVIFIIPGSKETKNSNGVDYSVYRAIIYKREQKFLKAERIVFSRKNYFTGIRVDLNSDEGLNGEPLIYKFDTNMRAGIFTKEGKKIADVAENPDDLLSGFMGTRRELKFREGDLVTLKVCGDKKLLYGECYEKKD